jgi:hypothetical protein
MIRIPKLHSNTNWNYKTVSSTLCITMSLLMLNVFEKLFAEHFASQRENLY